MGARLYLDNHDLPLGHIQKEHERNSSNHQNGQENVKGRQKNSYQLQPLTQKSHRSSSQVNFVVRVSRHKRQYGLKRADGIDQLRGSGAIFLSGMVFTIIVTLPCSSIKIVRKALPFPEMPLYGVMIRCKKPCRSVMSMMPRSTLALATTSGVPSVEPPSEFTRTARHSGKYLARPAMTALTTWPIVLELLKLGMPTRISACAISRICVSVRSSNLNSVASGMLGSTCCQPTPVASFVLVSES